MCFTTNYIVFGFNYTCRMRDVQFEASKLYIHMLDKHLKLHISLITLLTCLS